MGDSIDAQTCPICQMPLEKNASGSLTQWIRVCRCGVPNVAETAPAANICRVCGKRVEVGKSGTLTQWIFRDNLCSCESPSLVFHPELETGSERSSAANQELEDLKLLPELVLDPDWFPLERYRPVKALGAGGAGSVYLCIDRVLNKAVALKVLNELGKSQLIAFQKEAKVTSQLDHTNIVRVFDFGITNGMYPFMVMEYVRGSSLAELIEADGPLAVEDMVPIFEAVCDALIYLHRRNLFHRDLKPSNILVSKTSSGRATVRLVDFGLGAAEEDTTSDASSFGGTPLYMSPEKALHRVYDARSEIYSVGCAMFEALTGRPPFHGKDALNTISLHADAELPTLSQMHGGKDFPERIETLVATCLSKSPDDRYQAADELKQALVQSTLDEQTGEPQSEHPPTATNHNVAVLISVLAIGIICGIGAMYVWATSSPVPDASVEKTKKTEPEPSLSDAVQSMQANTWHKGADTFGYPGWISRQGIDDEDMESLLKEEDLKYVMIDPTDTFTGSGFHYLEGHNVEWVAVTSTALDDSGLEALSRIKTLTSVKISHAPKITSEGIAHLAKLPHLDDLELVTTPVPANAFKAISRIRMLKTISLFDSTGTTADDMSVLQKSLPDLAELELSGSGLDNKIIPIVAKMKALTSIRFCRLKLSDDHLELLQNLPALSALGLSETPVSDRGLQKLIHCRALSGLELYDCPNISLKGIAAFKKAWKKENAGYIEIGTQKARRGGDES